MFIKFGDHFFDESHVRRVYKVDEGILQVTTNTDTVEVIAVPEEDWETFLQCFTIRRRRYSSYADYRRSKFEEEPKEDNESIEKYSKIEEE